MFKSFSFLLLALLSTVSDVSAMRDDRTEKMRARLQKQREQKDQRNNEPKEFQKLRENVFNAVMENELSFLPCSASTITHKNFAPEILASLENKKSKFTLKQMVDIETAFRHQGLDLAQTLIIQENLKNSLKSAMKYQESVNNLLSRESKFYTGINPDFSASQAFGSHVLPFTHKSRKKLIMALFVKSDGSLKVLSFCRKNLEGKDLQKPLNLLVMYAAIFDVCSLCHRNSVEMLTAFDNDKALRAKYRRLASSLYDGEIELLLKHSNALLPYVNIIQNVLQIDVFDEVFSCKKTIEDYLDKQRQENQRGPRLLEKYKLFLQERAKKTHPSTLVKSTNINTPKPTGVASSSEKQMFPEESPEEFTGDIQSPVNTNEKSKYREPSEQEKAAERKRLAKEQKKVNAVPSLAKEKEPESSSEKEPKHLKKNDFSIEIGGGPFKIFNKVMDQSFKGTIEKIVLLIEALGGSVDDGRSGSRIKIELPYINSNKKAYLDILPPEEEEESETPKTITNTNTNTNSNSTATTTTAESVMHAPHKGKSKKLRFYHTKDVRELLMDAGYTPNVVLKGSQ